MPLDRLAKYVYVIYVIFKLYYFSSIHKNTQ